MRRKLIIAAVCAALLTGIEASAQDQQAPTAAEPAQAQQQERLRARIHDPSLTQEERQARREQWQKLSEEERAQLREERREQWQGMTPEEQAQVREQVRERREEQRQKWQALSPEEQAQIREQRRQRWEAMSPEQQEQIRQRRQEHRRIHSSQRSSGSDAGQRGGGGRGPGGSL